MMGYLPEPDPVVPWTGHYIRKLEDSKIIAKEECNVNKERIGIPW